MGQIVQLQQMWTAVGGLIVVYSLKIVGAIVFLAVGYVLAKLTHRWIKKLLARQRIDATLISFFGSFTYYAILVFAGIAALARVGVQTTSVIAIIGAGGLAIGLALRGTLANVAAGLFLVLFPPFKAGHYIQAAGTSGTVDEINMFTTRLRTSDNVPVIIPNSKLISDIIVNYSEAETRRVELVFPVSADKEIKKVREVLNSLIGSDSRILSEPAPFVGIKDLADNIVNFIVQVWVKNDDYRNVKSDFNERVKERFRAEGI
ncbi:MAG: mechanosensitive ion channel domain-containing protein [Desulfomonilaceae bacterium]